MHRRIALRRPPTGYFITLPRPIGTARRRRTIYFWHIDFRREICYSRRIIAMLLNARQA